MSKKYREWSKESLEQAVTAVGEGTMRVNMAARTFGVSKPTIKRYLIPKEIEPLGRPCTFSK